MFARRLSIVALAVSTAALFVFGAACTIQTGDPIDDEDTNLFEDDTDDGIDPFDSGMDDDTGMTEDDTGTMDDDTGGDPGGDTDATEMCQETCCFFEDTCAEGENCYITQDGRQCAAYTEGAQPGDSCSSNTDCGNLQLCNPQEGVCQNRCDPDASSSENACGENKGCVQLADQNMNPLPLGLCQANCQEFPNDDCPDGENCYPTRSGGKICAQYDDTASVGDSCQSPTDCNDAQACVQGECRDKCTQEGDGPCSGEECQPLQDQDGNQLDFGVCPK